VRNIEEIQSIKHAHTITTHTVDEDTPVIAIGSEKDQERVDKKDGIDGQVEAQPPLVNEAEITSADAQMKWNVQCVVDDH
jgi:hypothetical protein